MKKVSRKVMVILSMAIMFSLLLPITNVMKGFKNHIRKEHIFINNSNVLTVSFNQKLSGGKMIKEKFTISEDVFFEENQSYNNDLSLFSFAIAVSSFSSGDLNAHWGEDGDFGRENSIRRTFDSIGLDEQRYIGYDVSLNTSVSKAAFAIGEREIHKGNNSAYLIVISVRGGGYGAEWSDNFSLGKDGTYHKGFEKAANYIKSYADDYIKEICKNKNIVILVTGYSRGGAVANILCDKFYNENKEHKVIGYTFATPNTTTTNSTIKSLYNVINPYDAITSLPPQKWGFVRCGKDVIFPQKNTQKPILEIYDKVSLMYNNITGSDYDMMGENNSKILIDIMLALSDNRKHFSEKFEPVFKDIMLFNFTKTKNKKWERVGFIKFITDRYGIKAIKIINEFKNKINISDSDETDIKIPDEIVNFLILNEIHGINVGNDFNISSLGSESLKTLYNTVSKSSFSIDTKPHSFETYLSWLKSYENWYYLI